MPFFNGLLSLDLVAFFVGLLSSDTALFSAGLLSLETCPFQRLAVLGFLALLSV
jgi:hypothetical protein